jgi:hypothetical protein
MSCTLEPSQLQGWFDSTARLTIFPVKVTTTEQMANPKKAIGIVSRAVKPRDITEETVAARGGASMSDVQYA